MGYTRPIRFEPGTFLRPCDLCGIRFRANELVRGTDQKFRCIRWCAEQTQLDRDNITAAAAKRKEAPPPPFGVPFVFKDAYAQEGVLFNFLVNQRFPDASWSGGARLGILPARQGIGSGTAVVAGDYSASAAGEGMRYLSGIILENKRPAQWILQSRRKLRELADFLITIQNGFGVNPTFTKSTSAIFGAFSFAGAQTVTGVVFESCAMGQCGLGMLLAYRVLGDGKYLASARAAADFVTNLQRGGLKASVPSSSDAGGASPIDYGTWTRGCNATATSWDHVYRPDSLVCLEFLNELTKTVGDELHGADTTAGGVFTAAPQQLMSVSIANARAFWKVGAFDAVTLTTLTGLSASTPKLQFNSYPAAGKLVTTGLGAWEYSDGTPATGTLINHSMFGAATSQLSSNCQIALALRSLFNFEGMSAQVASVYTWLMGFGSNPAFQSSKSSRGLDAPTALGFAGVYNPKLACAEVLQVKPAAMNGGNLCDLAASGILAPIQAATAPASLEAMKDFATQGAGNLPDDLAYGPASSTYAMLIGEAGLGKQLNVAAARGQVVFRADACACIGQAFRVGTTSYPLQV